MDGFPEGLILNLIKYLNELGGWWGKGAGHIRGRGGEKDRIRGALRGLGQITRGATDKKEGD